MNEEGRHYPRLIHNRLFFSSRTDDTEPDDLTVPAVSDMDKLLVALEEYFNSPEVIASIARVADEWGSKRISFRTLGMLETTCSTESAEVTDLINLYLVLKDAMQYAKTNATSEYALLKNVIDGADNCKQQFMQCPEVVSKAWIFGSNRTQI